MSEIIPFRSIKDFRPIARDFHELLNLPENADIALDFPESVARYANDLEQSAQELALVADQCEDGAYEQSIIYDGMRAVGLATIQRVDDTPEAVPSGTPNISEFICRPHRGLGLGQLSLRHHLDIIDHRFEGIAFAEVRRENEIPQHIVEKLGLVAVSADKKYIQYLYRQQ